MQSDIDNRNADTLSTEEENTDKYEKADYYFEDYCKHLTVYKNGNGIIINSFTIVINNIDSVTSFKRGLDINDARASANFPKLKIMKKTELKDRFCKFGFWCKCLNNNKLISSIEEKYWTESEENNDDISRADPKYLKWILRMNPSSIEIGKKYKIVYVLSIPGMFPVENGIFNDVIANIKGTHGAYTTKFRVKHPMKKFEYVVSFENGFKLFEDPTGKFEKHDSENNLHFVNESNIIYDKYVFYVNEPDINSAIKVKWKFIERINPKNGGMSYENI